MSSGPHLVLLRNFQDCSCQSSEDYGDWVIKFSTLKMLICFAVLSIISLFQSKTALYSGVKLQKVFLFVWFLQFFLILSFSLSSITETSIFLFQLFYSNLFFNSEFIFYFNNPCHWFPSESTSMLEFICLFLHAVIWSCKFKGCSLISSVMVFGGFVFEDS